MAKQLVNRSKNIQFLKTSAPPPLYSSSIQLKPGQILTVSDEDYAAMTIPSTIQVLYVADDVIDTVEEVEEIASSAPATVADAIVDGVTTVAPSQNVVFDALALKVNTSLLGAVNGVATLDGSGKVPLAQVPSTLQSDYNADPDGSGASIVTNATDGSVIISGTESLQISATGGLDMTTAPIKTTTANGNIFFQPQGNGRIIAESSTSVAVGNTRGTNAVDLQMKKALVTQVASATNSVIIGGTNNTANGTSTFIGSGETNTATGIRSSIIGGTTNTIATLGQSSFIGAGENNIIGNGTALMSGNISGIGAGRFNEVYGGLNFVASGERNVVYSANSFVGAGLFNKVGFYMKTSTFEGSSGVVSLGGGDHNFIFGSQANLAGGAYNHIGRDGINEAICGGSVNSTVSTQGAFIGGGIRNSVSGNNSVVSGGSQNNVTGGTSAIGGGSNNVITVGNSFTAGTGNWISGANSAVFGAHSTAAHSAVAMFGRGARTTANFDLAMGNDSNSQTSGCPDAVHFRVAGDTSSVHVGRTTDQPLTDIAQTATLTIAEPAVFTVTTAPANDSIVTLTTTGTLPANITQPVIISTTIDPLITGQRPVLLLRGTAVFTFATPEKSRFVFSQLGSFYDVVGAGKAIQLFDGAGAGHYFWFKVGTGAVNVQTDPLLVGTGHQVTVLPADTSAQVATNFYNSFIVTTGSLFTFNVVNTTASRVDVSNIVGGPATDATVTGSAATLTILTQGSLGTNPVANGAQMFFPTGGASLSNAGYPAGIAAGTNYYVVNSTGLTFNLALTPGGTPILVTGFQDTTSTVGGNIGALHQITIRGLQTGVRYFVVNSAGTTFNISYSLGGPAIPCYGTQSGTHTATTRTFSNANNYTFTIPSSSITVGTTYTNNGSTFTVVSSTTSSTSLLTVSSGGAPTPTGTLTFVSGSPSGNITYTAATTQAVTIQNKLYLHTTNISNQSKAVSLAAPTTLTANVDLVLPSTVGSSGNALISDGSGVMSWGNNTTLLTTSPTVADTTHTVTSDGIFTALAAKQDAIGVGAKSSATDAGFYGQLSTDGTALFICTVAGAGGAATWKQIALAPAA